MKHPSTLTVCTSRASNVLSQVVESEPDCEWLLPDPVREIWQGIFYITLHNVYYGYSMKYHVYILECNDGTLYVGSTSDIEKRMHAHNHLKSGAHYTKIRRPVVLRYVEQVETYAMARSREAELKRLSREEKKELITRSVII
jgi:putative endonuclease